VFDARPPRNFDGSSTEQAPGTDSEVLMKPAAFYPDPFRPGDNIIVVCDCYKPDANKPEGIGDAIPTNTRARCAQIMKICEGKEPWFGIEQARSPSRPPSTLPNIARARWHRRSWLVTDCWCVLPCAGVYAV
jgi:hypothetical protein